MSNNTENTQLKPKDPGLQIISEAEQGSPFSQLAAADMCYARSHFDDAFYWYSIAVRSFTSNPDAYSAEVIKYEVSAAECNLAGMFFNGLGTDTDKIQAFRLYAEAARKRYVKAQLQLGMMYVYAEGIQQHYGLGYAWLNAAQLNGEDNKEIKKVLKMIEAKMDRKALDNARKMSEQWIDEAILEKLALRKKTRFSFISNWFKKS
ncbi:tetratricopeptide repeat protein [Moritella sp. Urea-trap-13]|uniref:tetratricopeptide repeat protein n=1 Tax=Moritella sp. Urea-trap-13 TaxID=2058327 RepID=UPI000C346CFB|nr:SEL1-like repeat protein [Moritella sp. Urea-trap-13]PKH08029.1 sel1 repeat family protein [Moritella sp. Urea-trap-13]